jgi:outer membrane protein assembly factor BamE (lipoprotein component of BamABCDE complex)
MRPSARLAAFALFATTALSGCILGRVRDGAPLDEDRVAKIKVGQSTKRDVVELLGAPTYVNDRLGFRVMAPGAGNLQAGTVAAPLVDELVRSPLDHSYTYEYLDTKSASLYLLVVSFTNQETKRDRVTVFFDEKGVVTHKGITLDAKNVEFRLPTSD